ncbi:MAG: hypothetical protein V9G10_15535 [Candidatus Nanopelagicales bacterium]
MGRAPLWQTEPETAELVEVSADLLGFVVWFFAGGILLLVFEYDFSWKWPVLALLTLDGVADRPRVLGLCSAPGLSGRP